jgi:hypothetical protein
MSNRPPVTPPGADRLSSFWLDVEYTRIAPTFTAAGIGTLLLKGPAFDQLLFDAQRSRQYSDIDLLVDPVRLVAAERMLEQLGFRPTKRPSALRRLAERVGVAIGVLGVAHGAAWVRDRDGFTIDLHRSVPRTGAPPEAVWRALSAHRQTITVVEAQVETLDPTASALLIALHAAHHGPGWNRARTDLQLACERLEHDRWRAAKLLARSLRAEAAIGIGLGTVNEGCVIARELGLRTRPTLGYRLNWLATSWIDRRRRS